MLAAALRRRLREQELLSSVEGMIAEVSRTANAVLLACRDSID
jgi:hypothetical protein